MAYVPKLNWKLDDTVTEKDFNRIEGGIKETLDKYKDVETTISELFTSVSNGKEQVAKAITDQGVPAVKEDTFTDLATKIKQINTGKKWAEGTIPRRNLDYGEPYYLDVNQLEFKPSMILMEYKLADEHPGTLQYCRMYTEIFDIRKMNEVEICLSGNAIGTCEPFSIQDNGFSVLVYRAPNNSNKRKVWGSWYASE
ncbi:hypothetical protein ABNF65_14485 [Paenibacillus larvae]